MFRKCTCKHGIDASPANTCRQNNPNGRTTRDEAEGRDAWIMSSSDICEREQVYGQRLIGVPPLALPGRAVGLASQCSTFDPRSCARIVVLHPDLYYYYRPSPGLRARSSHFKCTSSS